MGGRGDLVGRVIEATGRYSVKGMVVVLGERGIQTKSRSCNFVWT